MDVTYLLVKLSLYLKQKLEINLLGYRFRENCLYQNFVLDTELRWHDITEKGKFPISVGICMYLSVGDTKLRFLVMQGCL